MKKVFGRLSDISIRKITSDDWESYRNYCKGLIAPAHFRGIMEGTDLDSPQTYQNLFNAIGSHNVMFGLWDKDKMIGQTGIFFEEQDGQSVAMLQGSEIAKEYRGFGLSQTLYEARMNHLKEIGYRGKVITSIRPDNEYSLRAAKKNGFKETGQTVHDKIILERMFAP